MSWAEKHSLSERLASDASAASRTGDQGRAQRLYESAAEAEREAFLILGLEKVRTRGITAVSVASLFYKAKDFKTAESFACRCVANEALPPFAVAQLQNLLQAIWTDGAIKAAGLNFSAQDVLVSVRGGEILTGGAPLDLILRKVEEIRAIFYKTIEFLMDLPLRRRGGPSQDVQQLFRPWLFQAPAGSYQFAVRLESPKQLEFAIVRRQIPDVEVVTRKFIEIINSAGHDPEGALLESVPDEDYRNAFLKLTRNLSPSGGSYAELEITSAVQGSVEPIVLRSESRKAINELFRKRRGSLSDQGEGEEIQLRGVLRAVHLDEDWIEVTISAPHEEHIRVEKATEAIDDIVGPMVNRPVTVDAIKTPTGQYRFKDIQAFE